MVKIKTLSWARMKNGARFLVDEVFLAKLKALTTSVESAFNNEDKYLQMLQSIEFTALLADANNECDTLRLLPHRSRTGGVTDRVG